MPATERYQVNIFGIVVLITSVLILVFLIIAAIYFFNLMNLKPPSRAESTFLFWTAIVLAIISAIIIIYSLIHIFTHKAVIYEPLVETKTEVKPVLAAPTITTSTTSPIAISNIPQTIIPSSRSLSYSSLPVTTSQRAALGQELITLQAAQGP